ncbi:MAG: DUF1684 domain-containing protein [Ignavibacteria bacterium]|nr:DUF1684 domain-containing protein [Ignavibacteria bacterium]
MNKSSAVVLILFVVVTATSLARVRVDGPLCMAGGKVLPQDRTTADSLVRLIEKQRREEELWLKQGATSYLATILRKDFGSLSALTVGRDESNDLRIDDPAIASQHLRVTVVGDSFHVQSLDPSHPFLYRNETMREAILPPLSVKIGRYLLRLSHQRFPGLIVFDPESPRFKEYKGLSYFPIDLSYRFVLPLIPNPTSDTVIILSTRGNQRRALRAGWFEFTVDRKKARLEVSRLLEPGVGDQGYSIFFRDATSGEETYELGRYLDVEALPDGRFVVDFNRAYNPACAFSEHYNCPIPPAANNLSIPIRAGEKDSKYLKH